MPTPAFSPYNAAGRSSYHNNASAQGLQRTTALPARTNFTACGWGVRRSNRATYSSIFTLENGTTGLFLQTLANGSDFSIWTDGAGADQPNLLTLADNVPFFFAVTGNGSTATLYAARVGDNALVSESCTNTTVTPSIMWFGGSHYTTDWMDCGLSALKVWDAVLTPAELLREMKNPQAPKRVADLHGWWPLEGGPNEFLLDRSGNGRDLTLIGPATIEPYFLPKPVLPKRRKALYVVNGVTGSAAINDAADTMAAAGAVNVTASGASTDTEDTAVGAASVAVAGNGAMADSTDTMAAAGVTLGIVDAHDQASGSGTVHVSGSLAANDGGDSIHGLSYGQPVGGWELVEDTEFRIMMNAPRYAVATQYATPQVVVQAQGFRVEVQAQYLLVTL